MKILIVTQKVDQNDDILGFFHRWIAEFAKHFEQVTVIALGVGEYNLPNNVRVFSLGKECGVSRFGYIFNFYRLIWRERKNYDTVFVHMNPVYVILGGLLWRSLGKKIGLWYTHKNVDMKLRIAVKISHIIFTASEKSFRLPNKKVLVTGHGIDVTQWIPHSREPHNVIQIVTVGRIAPIKDYETLLRAVKILTQQNLPVHLEIIGDVVKNEDKTYLAKLKEIVSTQGLEHVVEFAGAVPNRLLLERVANADIFVNMSKTGSLDKAVLEAMACESITVTSNEAFKEVLGDYATMLMFHPGDSESLAKKIKILSSLDKKEKNGITKHLRNVIVEKHNIEVLILRILTSYETSR